MQNNRKKSDAELVQGPGLENGKCLRANHGPRQRLISYKMMNELGQRAVRTQMSGIAEVQSFLKANEAELVETAA